MKITEDMREDGRWLVQTLNRTQGADPEDRKIAWGDLSAAGWTDVFQRMSGTWRQFDHNQRPTERMSFRKCAALLQTCGVFKASQVQAALEIWIASPDGGYEPSPADLYGLIAGRSSDPVQNAKPGCRPESRPEVLSLVAELIGLGTEDVCDCRPRPTGVNFVMDERSVIFCPICAGIEQGQATEAEYHAEPFDDGRDEPQDISSTVLLRRARLEKRRRIGMKEEASA